MGRGGMGPLDWDPMAELGLNWDPKTELESGGWTGTPKPDWDPKIGLTTQDWDPRDGLGPQNWTGTPKINWDSWAGLGPQK